MDTDASTNILSLHIKCLGHSMRKNHLRATSSGKDRVVAVVYFGAYVFGFKGGIYQGMHPYARNGW